MLLDDSLDAERLEEDDDADSPPDTLLEDDSEDAETLLDELLLHSRT